jgi:ankyrin repeat protein
MEKSKSDDHIKTDIIPAAPSHVRKSSSSVNFLSNSRTKVTKYLPSFDADSTQHKKRGTGVLASDVDLAASPEVFAKGCSLLQLCAIGDLGKVVNYVTNTFDNVNFRDYDRRTGLHVASSEGHLEVVKYLLTKGARINRTDRWGGSPLDDAHRHRNTDVAKFLRSKGGKSGSLNLTTNLITAAAAGDIEGTC